MINREAKRTVQLIDKYVEKLRDETWCLEEMVESWEHYCKLLEEVVKASRSVTPNKKLTEALQELDAYLDTPVLA